MANPSWAQRMAEEFNQERALDTAAPQLWSDLLKTIRERCDAVNAAIGETVLIFEQLGETYIAVRNAKTSVRPQGDHQPSSHLIMVGHLSLQVAIDSHTGTAHLRNVADKSPMDVTDIAERALTELLR